MRYASLLLFLLVLGGSWRHVRCTCVLESEFGFTLNCAFKKSGLFRVRNLGGIKAHVGLGFTVGDELGFKESLSNLEGNRRRSTQTNGFQNALLAANANAQRNNANNRITVRQPQPKPQPVPQPIVGSAPTKISTAVGSVPPFKPIPPAPERPMTPTDRILTMTAVNATKPARVPNMPSPALIGVAVPAFQAMPSSISRISASQAATADAPTKPSLIAVVANQAPTADAKNKLSSSNLALRTLPNPTASVDLPAALPQTSTNSIQALAAVSNISMEAIEAAILIRQQQLLKQQQQYSTTSAPTTTSQRPTAPTPKRQLSSSSKVMNAPKEYYPVGYDKNFDDNFASRVELPDTSFYCGDQKHFPGLYADEDLGCMVFHVCALTDDGLIMKSFLCPESTLFDQTILKCNWWFYVDCKNSRKLYDSNIPISKSYQLMKALTFFSSYKRDQSGTTTTTASPTTTK